MVPIFSSCSSINQKQKPLDEVISEYSSYDVDQFIEDRIRSYDLEDLLKIREYEDDIISYVFKQITYDVVFDNDVKDFDGNTAWDYVAGYLDTFEEDYKDGVYGSASRFDAFKDLIESNSSKSDNILLEYFRRNK